MRTTYKKPIYKEMHKAGVTVCMTERGGGWLYIWYCSSCVKNYKKRLVDNLVDNKK